MIQYQFSVPVSNPWWVVGWLWGKPKTEDVKAFCPDCQTTHTYPAKRYLTIYGFGWARLYTICW